MFCENCGKEIKDNDKFCPYCGKQTYQKATGNVKSSKAKQHRKSKKNKAGYFLKWIGIAVLIFMAIFVIRNIIDMTKDTKETLQKLQKYTDLYSTDSGYTFEYGGKWKLRYTDVNEAAVISEPLISQYFSEIFSVSDTGNDGTFAYDFDTGNLHMYFDPDIPEVSLSIITYNLNTDEYTMLDTEHYKLSDEFVSIIDGYGITQLLKKDVEEFKDDLQNMELTVGKAERLSYSAIKRNVGTIEKKPERNLIKDIEDLLEVSVQEARKLGMEPPDGFEGDDYLTNENTSLFLSYSNGKMETINMREACPYPFHGVYIGDNLDEACIKLEVDFEILISDPEAGYLIAADSNRNMSVWMGNASLDNNRSIETIDINLDVDIEALKKELLSDYEAETIEPEPELEEETTFEENNQSGLFIGMSGQYQCGSNMDSGVIDVYVQGTEINIAIGTHGQPGIIGGTGGGIWGTINDSTTAVVSWNDCTFTMVWSDTGVFTIYRDGQTGIPEVDNCTIDGVEYVNASFYQVS